MTVRLATAPLVLASLLAGGVAAAQIPVRPPSGRPLVTPRPPPRATQTSPSPPGSGPTSPTGPTTPAPRTDAERERARNKGKFQLAFDKAEITDVVQAISNFTGKLFIVPENIRGKITIYGPDSGDGYVNKDEAYSAFLAALEANGWTLYPVGKFLKLVEKRNASNSNVWTYLDPKAELPDDERMVTQVVRLHYIDADSVVNPLKQLVSKDATLIPMGPDTLIVTEVALNLRRIQRILDALDQPGGGEEMRVIQIEYADATALADKITQAFEDKAAKGARPSPRAPIKAGGATGPTVPPTDTSGDTGTEGGPVNISRVIPDERTNKLIIIANPKSFPRIEDLIRQLDVPTGDTGRVNVYYLENANAEDLAATLQALTTGQTGGTQNQRNQPRRPGAAGAPGAPGPDAVTTAELFSGEVKISADKSTNSLVVVASAQDYKNLTRVIEKLDIRRRQVFVEAVIMEVNLQNDNEFGVGLHGGQAIDTGSGIAPLLLASKVGKSNSLQATSLVSLGGFLAGLQGPPISGTGNLGISLPSFGVVLHALTKSSDVNILSTPHVLTSDNEEAEITVGQNVPFQAGFSPGGGLSNLAGLAGQAGGSNNANNAALAASLLGGGGLSSLYAPIQRQNVELKLKIKPQINESDYVRLQVEEQTEEIASQDPSLGPTTAKRTAKTVVVAKDQSTVVIGGLIQERTISSVNKTPVLGDVPILGWLFRDSATTKIKTNLLLFLTPYIIRDETDFRRIFERKMREREEFVAAFYGTSPKYDVPVDFARKSGPLAHLNRAVAAEEKKAQNGGPGGAGEKVIQPRGGDAPPAGQAPAAAPGGEAAPESGTAPAPADGAAPPPAGAPPPAAPAPAPAPAQQEPATPPAAAPPAPEPPAEPAPAAPQAGP